VRLEASGIDDEIRPIAIAPATVVAVPGKPWIIAYQRSARRRQAVE
jgi:hypothetical protein